MFKYIFNKQNILFIINICLIFLFFIFIELISVHYIDISSVKIFIISSIITNFTSLLFYKRQYYKHFIIAFIFFISVLYIAIFTRSDINYDNIKFLLAFYIGITNIFLILACLLNKKLKYVSYIFQLIILLPTLFIWQYFFISNSFINGDTILAIFQTNFDEAKAYICNSMGIKQIIGLLIFLFCLFKIIRYNNNLKLNNYKRIATFIILIISLYLNFFLVYKYKDNIVMYVATETKKYLKEYDNFKKMSSLRKIGNIKFDETENMNKGVYVLVIGESQNRDHMSAYGYSKETTPWLNKMQNNKNFIKFLNGYSCHTHTVPVLYYALTSQNQYNSIPTYDSVSILDVAKELDINTVWLSNQYHYGLWDNPLSVIADTAQQQKWINKNFGMTTHTNCYDINLVKELKNIKIYDNMFILIHLMGSHMPYKESYPENFDMFKDENLTIAQYDNSILYNDYVMENIFNAVKEIPNFKALIYFADHADAVDYGLYHDTSQYVPSMTHIPIYLYLSDSYIKNNLQIYENLKKHQNYYFTNDLIFNLVFGILNVKISSIYEPNNDIISESYDNNINRFRTLYNKRGISDLGDFLKYNNVTPSEYENKRIITIPKNSIWLHRVNNKKRLKYYLDKYTGFEIDINFNKYENNFNVSHDNIEGDESLYYMLENINGLENKYLWLDFKNLSQNNKFISLQTLNKIVEDNNLSKEHIIVESNNPQELSIFKQAGYYTSFYLNCYEYDNVNDLQILLSQDIKKLEESDVDFVSSDAKFFDIVKTVFPKVGHLFWVMNEVENQQERTKYILKEDKNAYVILNHNMEKYYN